MRGNLHFTEERWQQLNWALANKYTFNLIEEYKIVNDMPKISDHKPIES